MFESISPIAFSIIQRVVGCKSSQDDRSGGRFTWDKANEPGALTIEEYYDAYYRNTHGLRNIDGSVGTEEAKTSTLGKTNVGARETKRSQCDLFLFLTTWGQTNPHEVQCTNVGTQALAGFVDLLAAASGRGAKKRRWIMYGGMVVPCLALNLDVKLPGWTS
jgi:hypothetical protein